MRERRHVNRNETPSAESPGMSGLRSEIRELAASIHAAEAELNRKLVALDDGDGWCGAGIRSMAHWLTLTCGFTRSEARRRAELVRCREEFPSLFGAFDEGRLSVGFTHCAQKVATPATDAEIARVSTTCTHTQAARTFASFRSTAEAIDEQSRKRFGSTEEAAGPEPQSPGADDPDGYDPIDRGVWFNSWWDDQEHLRVDARLDATDGATLRELLGHLRNHGLPGAGCAGSETPAAGASGGSSGAPVGDARSGERDNGSGRWLSQPEAFAAALRLAGDALADARVHGRWIDRFAITVTIDAEALAGLRPGSGLLADGTTVAAEQVRSWIEQATLEPLLMRGGRPLYLGRSVRLATPAQRRALRARDGGCAFPGCACSEGIEAHHLLEWSDGGLTDIDQMVLLCRRHHRLLHSGEFTITMQDGLPRIHSQVLGAVADRPHGQPLKDHPGSDPPPCNATSRYCEPLTTYALDVLVGSLLTARESADSPQPVAA